MNYGRENSSQDESRIRKCLQYHILTFDSWFRRAPTRERLKLVFDRAVDEGSVNCPIR